MQTLDFRNIPDSVTLHQEACRQRSLLMAEMLSRGLRRIAMWTRGATQAPRQPQQRLTAGRMSAQG